MAGGDLLPAGRRPLHGRRARRGGPAEVPRVLRQGDRAQPELRQHVPQQAHRDGQVHGAREAAEGRGGAGDQGERQGRHQGRRGEGPGRAAPGAHGGVQEAVRRTQPEVLRSRQGGQGRSGGRHHQVVQAPPPKAWNPGGFQAFGPAPLAHPGKPEAEGGALAEVRLRAERAPVQPRERRGDVQAQAVPVAARARRAVKAPEDVGDLRGRHALAPIPHVNDREPRGEGQPHLDAPALATVLHRVGQEVVEDVAHALGIKDERQRLLGALQGEVHLGLEFTPLLHHRMEERGEVSGLLVKHHLAIREPGGIEDGGDEAVHPVELPQNGLGVFRVGVIRLRRLLAQQHLGIEPRGAQGGFDLVRHPVEHLLAHGAAGGHRREAGLRRHGLGGTHAHHPAHGALEGFEIHGFAEKRIGLFQALRTRGAQEQEGHLAQPGVRPDRAQQIHAGAPGHHVVAHHEIRRLRPGQEQGLLPVVGPQGAVAHVFYDLGEDVEHRILVLGNEDEAHADSPPSAVPRARAWPVNSPSAERMGASTRMPSSLISNSRRFPSYRLSRIFRMDRTRWMRPRSST
ncbi:hypothetical protein STIAU_6786 [Stigmatella aurantiaca DW4/3-1]|uniref:Uncharacterized protein n=1 Tax=Stigmatella aurantiaca (strain DW4/3-1) TaxID=378806 RepID=Q08XC1_STIAD|nr:hypothetical protein STIAU_6786 [Stigmatella aurantiaca DW4/3-1]